MRSRETLTFLFADLRNYTAFIYEHGDADAATLIGSYRSIVRRAASAAGGATIKTEGDSFYIVFKTAGQAVDCAIATMRGAEERTASHPELPIAVGVGLHAGEPVPHERQYVGSAVNMAARLGQAAAAGEILISDTVRGLLLTSGLPPLEERSGLTLKGVGDPPRVYALDWRNATWTPRVRRTISRRAAIASGASLLMATGVGAAVLLLPRAGSAPVGQPSTLPPHGAALFDATFTPAAARRFQVVAARANDDRVIWLGDSAEITVAPGGSLALVVQDLSPDDLVAEIVARPVSGQGTFAFWFRGSAGRQTQVQLAPGTGEITVQVASGFDTATPQRIFGPASRLAPTQGDERRLVVVARGSELTIVSGEREVVRTTDLPAGSGVTGFLVTAARDRAFVVRLSALRIFAP